MCSRRSLAWLKYTPSFGYVNNGEYTFRQIFGNNFRRLFWLAVSRQGTGSSVTAHVPAVLYAEPSHTAE